MQLHRLMPPSVEPIWKLWVAWSKTRLTHHKGMCVSLVDRRRVECRDSQTICIRTRARAILFWPLNRSTAVCWTGCRPAVERGRRLQNKHWKIHREKGNSAIITPRGHGTPEPARGTWLHLKSVISARFKGFSPGATLSRNLWIVWKDSAGYTCSSCEHVVGKFIATIDKYSCTIYGWTLNGLLNCTTRNRIGKQNSTLWFVCTINSLECSHRCKTFKICCDFLRIILSEKSESSS